MLWFIWMLSILLSAISLLVMLALILRRMVLQRRRGQDAAERSRLLTALIAFSEDKNAKALETVLTSVPPRIATDAGFEFLGLLRGDEHARIVEIFAEAGLPAHIIARLGRGNEAARIHAAEMLAAFPSEKAAARRSTATGHARCASRPRCRFPTWVCCRHSRKCCDGSAALSGRDVWWNCSAGFPRSDSASSRSLLDPVSRLS
jgi:hypothetical protein